MRQDVCVCVIFEKQSIFHLNKMSQNTSVDLTNLESIKMQQEDNHMKVVKCYARAPVDFTVGIL